MQKGKFIILMGAMGSGKSMLVKHAIAKYPQLVIPYSYTTRPRRPDAVENDHYRFLSVEEFEEMIEKGAFLEWARFGDNYYGTLKSEVEQELAAGLVVLKEMEVQGVRQVRDLLPKHQLVTVFVDAGAWDELTERAKNRAPISDEELAKRRQRYEDEVTFIPEADQVITNRAGMQEEAKAAFEKIIEAAL
ncbi:MAG TPA: guanylate kinase [Candidatus Paceibacterota bacterium]|nr:guanylate kinase [Candidatus Paceibacterota bacterium]